MSFHSLTPSSHGRDDLPAARQQQASRSGTPSAGERPIRQRAEPAPIPRSPTAVSQADGAA